MDPLCEPTQKKMKRELLTTEELEDFNKRTSSGDIKNFGRSMDCFKINDNLQQQWRQAVLLQTLEALQTPELRSAMRDLALQNLELWQKQPPEDSIKDQFPISWQSGDKKVIVVQGDWGDVTKSLSMIYGKIMVVLNMAHAKSPGGGGGYVHGTPAQEENMFRRTDCHFSLTRDKMEQTPAKFINVLPGDFLYKAEMEDLINGKDGFVELDTKTPRICFRCGEKDANNFEGYELLPKDQIFPFYEMRAAAEDLRTDVHGKRRSEPEMKEAFDADACRKRIKAQFDTLKGAGQRYAVLSAFGCGAFGNPTEDVARIYAECLKAYRSDFDLIAFAIFNPGYGRGDNYGVFEQMFHESRL